MKDGGKYDSILRCNERREKKCILCKLRALIYVIVLFWLFYIEFMSTISKC